MQTDHVMYTYIRQYVKILTALHHTLNGIAIQSIHYSFQEQKFPLSVHNNTSILTLYIVYTLAHKTTLVVWTFYWFLSH